MNKISEKNTAARLRRIETIWIELKPSDVSFRTKIPMQPQKMPASIIKSELKFFSFIFL